MCYRHVVGRGAGTQGARPQAIGREAELTLLRDFVAPDAPAGSLVLTGGAGIGKTTLWESAVASATSSGLSVLSARPSEAEARLAFGGLCDLMDDVDTATLQGIPAPQRHALDAALLRVEPGAAAPEPHAVALGFLNALRSLSAQGRALVAIDDVQWLDTASADVLAFAVRRLRETTVRLLLSQRSGGQSAVVRALDAVGYTELDVDPLSLGATRRLLADRLGLTLPRRVLRRVFDTSHGNPLFVLLLGRTLAERGIPRVDEELAVPDDMEALLGARVSELPAEVRHVLLAVGLSGDLRRAELAALTNPAPFDEAFRAGLLVADGERIRPFHPLLAAAARTQADPAERRALHRALAEVVADETLRARHLALATDGLDEGLAGVVAVAAARSFARGAGEDAVELMEHAVRLTPEEGAAHAERLMQLAEYLYVVDPPRVVDLLGTRVEELPTATARVRAHVMLGDAAIKHVREVEYHLERALAEDTADAAARASVLTLQAIYMALCTVEQIERAEAIAREAEGAAGPDSFALCACGWACALQGKPVDDLLDRIGPADDAHDAIYHSVDRVAAVRLGWRGNLQEARDTLAKLKLRADERGEASSSITLLVHQAEVAIRSGNWPAALEYVNVLRESPDVDFVVPPAYERCRALIAAGRGDAQETERWVAATLAGYEATGIRWDMLEAMRARAIAALLSNDAARAAKSARPVWEHTEREGIEEPGAFPIAPELVEALVALGELEDAEGVTARLEELSAAQEHPWGSVTAQRCRALLELASDALAGDAAGRLAAAAAAYGELGMPFERARSLLALGRMERRRRRWASARSALTEAAEAFDAIGSGGWAEQARVAVARVGARKPTAEGELTPAERRVVELAAEGRSNKEIAAALFVTVNTVEAHLSHAYAKLGVRSRAQLAQRLSPPV